MEEPKVFTLTSVTVYLNEEEISALKEMIKKEKEIDDNRNVSSIIGEAILATHALKKYTKPNETT